MGLIDTVVVLSPSTSQSGYNGACKHLYARLSYITFISSLANKMSFSRTWARRTWMSSGPQLSLRVHSIARSHRSYIPVRNNTIWNSLLCSPRLSAGQSSISASHPTGKCPSVDLLLESTSISVPPSLARIRNDPRNLAVVPCACLWHDHFSSIVPSHCAYLSLLSSPLNVLTAIVCKHMYSENILLSL